MSLNLVLPSCRLRAKKSMQEAQVASEKFMKREGWKREKWEKLHPISGAHHEDSKVPVFVMLPLDTVTLGGKLNRPRAMDASLKALKSAGVEGVMVDAWWGLVEKDGPLKYNWEGYLVQMVQRNGLKLPFISAAEMLEIPAASPYLHGCLKRSAKTLILSTQTDRVGGILSTSLWVATLYRFLEEEHTYRYTMIHAELLQQIQGLPRRSCSGKLP